MTILVSRSYAGIASGAVVKLTTNLETALIGQNMAATSAAALTSGAQTINLPQASCAIAAAASSVVITNNLVDANTKILAVINQTAADTTLTSIVRIVPAAGSFTIFGNAAATAAVVVDWSIIPTATYGPLS